MGIIVRPQHTEVFRGKRYTTTRKKEIHNGKQKYIFAVVGANLPYMHYRLANSVFIFLRSLHYILFDTSAASS